MFEWRTFYFYWSIYFFYLVRPINFYSSITFEYFYHPCIHSFYHLQINFLFDLFAYLFVVLAA